MSGSPFTDRGRRRLRAPKLAVRLAALCGLALAGLLATSAGASAATVYDNVPSPLPGNLISEAFQATQTSEFGGQVNLAGTDRQDPTVTVAMSSWGCQSGTWFGGDCATTPGATFTHPITLNLYGVLPSGEPGSLIASVTQSFAIPFRPSHNDACSDTSQWSPNGGTDCFNGLATPIAFNLSGRGVSLPDRVIVAIAFNTTSYGENPIGTSAACFSTPHGCGYDSLNVGLTGPPSVGSLPRPVDAYLDSATPSQYCDGGTGGTGTLRLDAGCWLDTTPGDLEPAVQVDATTTTGAQGSQGPAGGVAGAVGSSTKCKKHKKHKTAIAAKKCKRHKKHH